MSKYKLVKTTYTTPYGDSEEVKELRFENGDYARFFKLASCCGRKCVRVKCYIDGEFESSDDVYGDYDNLTPKEAYRLAKGICVYFE